MTYGSATNHGKGVSQLKWVLLLAATGLLAFAAIEVLSLPISTVVTLLGSSLVAVIVGKYRTTLPGTQIQFHPKAVLSFWGAMWLGVTGGVVLGLLSSVAERWNDRCTAREKAQFVSGDVVGAAVSSVVYVAANAYFLGPGAGVAFVGLLVPNEVILASLLMGVGYFAVSTIISVAQGRSRGSSGSLILALQENLVTVFAAILLFLAFNHFGLEFGIVIIPLVLVGNVAYTIHTRLLAQQTGRVSEASRLHLATVEALATAIDARDQVGLGHVRRTQIYAVGIGESLGLTDGEINALRAGALLHDIGKLAVPDHILNKPGRLTPAEMEKTKTHAAVGASILETVGFPYPVVPTVKYHHECWDGSGYPDGLNGTQIPMTARILSVADAFDTLRGSRPYRAALERSEAVDVILSRRGTQFDPRIVEVLIRNLDRFEAEIEAAGLSYGRERRNPVAGAAGDQREAVPDFIEQIQRANHEVFSLYSLARDFSGSLNLEETLSLFTHKIAEFVPFDSCVVYLRDQTGTAAIAAHVRGAFEKELKGRRVAFDDGATGYALSKLKPVGNVDPMLDFAFSNAEIGQDFTSMVCVPLLADQKLIGAVSLYSSTLANYQDEHIRLVDTVSHIAADAIEKAIKHAEAQVYALTDPMTGLPNSRSLQIEFDKEVVRASRNSTTFQLLVLDLDGFKQVNDNYGHKVGDRLLKEIGTVIRQQMREYDFLARYGGDEFVAIVPETDAAEVKRLQRRIEEAVSALEIKIGDKASASVGVSLGSASYPSQGESFEELIVAADKAMYLTKAINKQRMRRMAEAVAASSDTRPADEAADVEVADAPELILFCDPDQVSENADSNLLRSTAVN